MFCWTHSGMFCLHMFRLCYVYVLVMLCWASYGYVLSMYVLFIFWLVFVVERTLCNCQREHFAFVYLFDKSTLYLCICWREHFVFVYLLARALCMQVLCGPRALHAPCWFFCPCSYFHRHDHHYDDHDDDDQDHDHDHHEYHPHHDHHVCGQTSQYFQSGSPVASSLFPRNSKMVLILIITWPTAQSHVNCKKPAYLSYGFISKVLNML